MKTDIYRIEYDANIPVEEIESTVVLTLLAVESLHGESQTQLDASHLLDAEQHVLIVDSNTAVGMDFARLLIGFLRREFRADAFRVSRVRSASSVEQPVSAAST